MVHSGLTRLTTIVLLAILPGLCGIACGSTRVYVSVAGDSRIQVYSLSDTGQLKLESECATDGEPGATLVHPGGQFLFAAIRSAGQLAAFAIDPENGSLTRINQIDAGADPAYVSLDRSGRWLFSAYYRAGKVSVHRLSPRGEIYPWPAHSVATNQNAHAIRVDRSNSTVLVPHTGPNAIYQFRFRARSGQLSPATPAYISTGPQTGPRHVAYHPERNVVYADNEQGSSVTRFDLDPDTGTLTARETVSTLPPGFTDRNTCARMQISSDGSLLFAANRGHDSIAAYRLGTRNGELNYVGAFPTEKTPRGFSLTPDGKFLIAAGQASGKLVVYAVRAKNENRLLERQQTLIAGSRPWWVTTFKPTSDSRVKK